MSAIDVYDVTITTAQWLADRRRDGGYGYVQETTARSLADTVPQAAVPVSAAPSAAWALEAQESALQAEAAAAVAGQGWVASSTTSLTVGTGAQSLAIETGKGFVPGMIVSIYRAAESGTIMTGLVSSYDSSTGALSVDVDAAIGSGTHSDWVVTVSGIRGAVGPVGPQGPQGEIGVTGSGSSIHARDQSGSLITAEPRASVQAGDGITLTDTGAAIRAEVVAGDGLQIHAGAVRVDAGIGPGQIVQLDGAGALPAVDGSALTGIETAKGLAELPAQIIGPASGNITLDLSQYSVFEVEPTGTLSIDVTGLASGARARALLVLTAAGRHTLSFGVNGAFGDWRWSGGMPPRLGTSGSLAQAEFLRSFDVSAWETSPRGVAISPDGTSLYVVGGSSDSVHRFALSPAWELTGAVHQESLNVWAWDPNPSGVAVSPDGTSLYVAGTTNDSVHRFELWPAWELTGAVHQESLNVWAWEPNPSGVAVSPDGAWLYVVGTSNRTVHRFALSPAWVLSGAVHQESLNVSAWEPSAVQGVAISADGTSLYTVGNSDNVHHFDLSPAWELSGAVHVSAFDVAAWEASPMELAAAADSQRLYIVGLSGVHEFLIAAHEVDILSIQQIGGNQVLVSKEASG